MTLAAFVLLLATAEPSAPPQLTRDTIIDNVRFCSSNRRYCLVMHQLSNVHPFRGRRADDVFRFRIGERTMPAGLAWVFTGPKRAHYTDGRGFPASSAALYDGTRRVAKLRFDDDWRGGDVLV